MPTTLDPRTARIQMPEGRTIVVDSHRIYEGYPSTFAEFILRRPHGRYAEGVHLAQVQIFDNGKVVVDDLTEAHPTWHDLDQTTANRHRGVAYELGQALRAQFPEALIWTGEYGQVAYGMRH